MPARVKTMLRVVPPAKIVKNSTHFFKWKHLVMRDGKLKAKVNKKRCYVVLDSSIKHNFITFAHATRLGLMTGKESKHRGGIKVRIRLKGGIQIRTKVRVSKHVTWEEKDFIIKLGANLLSKAEII